MTKAYVLLFMLCWLEAVRSFWSVPGTSYFWNVNSNGAMSGDAWNNFGILSISASGGYEINSDVVSNFNLPFSFTPQQTPATLIGNYSVGGLEISLEIILANDTNLAYAEYIYCFSGNATTLANLVISWGGELDCAEYCVLVAQENGLPHPPSSRWLAIFDNTPNPEGSNPDSGYALGNKYQFKAGGYIFTSFEYTLAPGSTECAVFFLTLSNPGTYNPTLTTRLDTIVSMRSQLFSQSTTAPIGYQPINWVDASDSNSVTGSSSISASPSTTISSSPSAAVSSSPSAAVSSSPSATVSSAPSASASFSPPARPSTCPASQLTLRAELPSECSSTKKIAKHCVNLGGIATCRDNSFRCLVFTNETFTSTSYSFLCPGCSDKCRPLSTEMCRQLGGSVQCTPPVRRATCSGIIP